MRGCDRQGEAPAQSLIVGFAITVARARLRGGMILMSHVICHALLSRGLPARERPASMRTEILGAGSGFAISRIRSLNASLKLPPQISKFGRDYGR